MNDEMAKWKASQAKPYAESVRHAKSVVDGLQQQVDSLKQTYDGIGAVRYDTIGGGGGMEHGDDRFAALVMRMNDAIERYVCQASDWVGMLDEFSRCCDEVGGEHSMLLRLRYCSDLPWRDVAKRMNYSEKHVSGWLNTQALASLYDVMPYSQRDPFPESMNHEFFD